MSNKKRIVFVAVVIMMIVIACLYTTYAVNVFEEETTPVEYDLAYNFDLSGSVTRQMVIKSGKTKSFDIEVSNPYDDEIKYGVAYSVVSPSSLPSGVIVAKSTLSKNETVDLVSSNGTSSVSVVVVNNSDTDITLSFSVISGYKNGGELIVPSGQFLVSGVYEVGSKSFATLLKLGLSDLLNEGTPNFNANATTDEGIYAAEDDLGTSYYFRGASERNYVKFANKYWRIIRINGDGSIRMIYDGTKARANGAANASNLTVGSVAFNSSETANAYIGYMYGSTLASDYNIYHNNAYNSTIKTYLEDTWYASTFNDTEYEQYISDAIYCNDRQVYSGTGVGTTSTNYMASDRIKSQAQNPILTCSQSNDRFTLDSGNFTIETNGKLNEPVGLITVDEIAMAGGRNGPPTTVANSAFYLFSTTAYWTMTPYSGGTTSQLFQMHYVGSIANSSASTSLGVRPVISLKADTPLVGTGTMTEPFEIKTTTANSSLTTLTNIGATTYGLTPYLKTNTPDFSKGNYQGTKEEFTVRLTEFFDTYYKDEDLYTDVETWLDMDYGMTLDEVYETFNSEDDNGIYAMEDDLGTSYYFRGNVTNNYVKFGKYTEDAYAIYDENTGTSSYANSCGTATDCTQIASANDDMYWRIVRINGDGTIRMVYDGTSPHANNVLYQNIEIGPSTFNKNDNDNTYVGYMTGTVHSNDYSLTHSNTNDSSIKTTIDRWYSKYLDTTYGTYIVNAIYCNDRSLSSGTGTGTTENYYNAYERVFDSEEISPILTCSQKNDRFTLQGETIETTDGLGGNQKLTYPVGLLTTDEVVLAGSNFGGINLNYYLYAGNYYWLGSASGFLDYADAFYVDGGNVSSSTVSNGLGVARPAISLKSDVLKYGDGTTGNPFRIEQ